VKKSRKSSLTFSSFQDLKGLLQKNSFSLADHPDPALKGDDREERPEPEEELFTKAMEGVTPISRENFIKSVPQTSLPVGTQSGDDAEVLLKLTNLVRHGIGFNVSDTPEYVEGTGYHVHPAFAKRLHRGDYSIQAHVDLHGFRAEDAKEAFEKFLKWAVDTGKRGVLVIHGRGLSSPSEPVLKKKVIEWLTRGPWRKWVVAYASARLCDGGVGATYVLLRQRPLSKRFRTKKDESEKKG
jgi:DNA-nicking Smr family endonuclease